MTRCMCMVFACFPHHSKLSTWCLYCVQLLFRVWIYFSSIQNFRTRGKLVTAEFAIFFCINQNLNLNWYIFNQNVMLCSLKFLAKRKRISDRHVSHIKWKYNQAMNGVVRVTFHNVFNGFSPNTNTRVLKRLNSIYKNCVMMFSLFTVK